MDLCVLDWKAFTPIVASLIASGTALWISNKWNKQKGGEVVANESKQVIKDLLEMVKILNFIKSDMYERKDKEIEFKKFKVLYDSTVIGILYMDDCIIVDGLKLKLKDLTNAGNEIKIRNDLSYVSNFSVSAINLVNLLNPYSIYISPCKFKSKK